MFQNVTQIVKKYFNDSKWRRMAIYYREKLPALSL